MRETTEGTNNDELFFLFCFKHLKNFTTEIHYSEK